MTLASLYAKKPIIFPLAILAVIGFFVYFFNLNNELFWDDNDWIINNNFVHTISWNNIKFWLTHNTLAGVGLKSNYYRPFLFFTFAINYVISGIKPLGYHLFSNLIHIANGVLIFFLFSKVLKRFDLFGDPRFSEWDSHSLGTLSNLGTAVAFLTALIFVIHPLQTEAVTYISGRGDLLVTFFMLLASLFFLKRFDLFKDPRFSEWDSHSLGTLSNLGFLALSLVSLILALLSRETAIIFPFLALIFYVSILFSRSDLEADKGRTFLRLIKTGLIKTWPYFVIVFVYGILRLTVLNFQNTLNFYTVANPYSENLHYRLFTFMHVLVDYFKLLFVPTDLHMERSMTVHTSLFQWPVWLGALIVFGILITLYRLYKNRHPDFKIWLFGWGLFFIALGPVSGVTPINAVIYEHWLYLPMVGFWFIISFYLVKLFTHLQGPTFFKIQGSRSGIPTPWELCRTLIIAGLVAYFSFFAYQAIQRNILWGNQLDFYLDILKYEPNSSRINNNVGNTYFNQNNKEQAEFYYRKAVEVGDAFAQPYYNLGSILQSKRDIFGAIQLYEKAIEINPGFYYPYQNLAVIYAQQGNLTKAIENIEKLKLLIPNNPRVYYNSALVYVALNNKGQALKDLRVGLKYGELDLQTSELIKELIKKLER